MKPRFITLEGGEGVGKTTNLDFIQDYLTSRGIVVLRTREPGGTSIGERVRDILLNSYAMDTWTELLLMFAARAQHISEVIRPALVSGKWVLSDRFTDASHAYQGGGRGLDGEIIGRLEAWVQQELQPDLTLLLDAPVELGMARAKNRGETDRFESERLDFFEKVRAAYLARAERFPERIRRVDASGSLAEVQSRIGGHLDALLESSDE
jgi:dTMP kinase